MIKQELRNRRVDEEIKKEMKQKCKCEHKKKIKLLEK